MLHQFEYEYNVVDKTYEVHRDLLGYDKPLLINRHSLTSDVLLFFVNRFYKFE